MASTCVAGLCTHGKTSLCTRQYELYSVYINVIGIADRYLFNFQSKFVSINEQHKCGSHAGGNWANLKGHLSSLLSWTHYAMHCWARASAKERV